MTCETGDDLDRCPTKAEILPRLMMLLPRGRAWGNHDGGPWPGSVLHGFWSAVAEVAEYVNQRICALQAEFNCGTAVETLDLWSADYGLPDACDPYADLCDKVRTPGGSQCDYYVSIAARMGWAVTCQTLPCGGVSGRAEADCAIAAPEWGDGDLLILVDLEASPAYAGPSRIQSEADLIEADYPVRCAVDFEPLECVLRRVVPSERNLRVEALWKPAILTWGGDELTWGGVPISWT